MIFRDLSGADSSGNKCITLKISPLITSIYVIVVIFFINYYKLLDICSNIKYNTFT